MTNYKPGDYGGLSFPRLALKRNEWHKPQFILFMVHFYLFFSPSVFSLEAASRETRNPPLVRQSPFLRPITVVGNISLPAKEVSQLSVMPRIHPDLIGCPVVSIL
ncbi:hypothetical protein BDV23DRAFT_143819 [Aspergillus alliaceus]|uniref:Uncharacterized protein n=1 Tax=Petromyces alliaceus TaxID=209559 RepID=A0A5N7CPV6_PETAA|nr:hypothetical protein BDV23DRAFT_143819 [Aspergillus alliaceus]